MSVLYATASELASYLQQDVDTSTATLTLQVVSELFAKRAHTRFESTATTYKAAGVNAFEIVLPFQPLIAVQAVRIRSVAVTDYTVIGPSVYRRLGFGSWWTFPPDLVEIDYTHGYTTVPDDVKGAVLESAAGAYMNPDVSTTSESIDDYTVRSSANGGGVQLSTSAQMLADYYAGVLVA
jgi:hypothetical protein